MCCSFYIYLPIIKSYLTGYSSIVTTSVDPVVGIICLLHASKWNCSIFLITLLKLQHILSLLYRLYFIFSVIPKEGLAGLVLAKSFLLWQQQRYKIGFCMTLLTCFEGMTSQSKHGGLGLGASLCTVDTVRCSGTTASSCSPDRSEVELDILVTNINISVCAAYVPKRWGGHNL